MDELLSSMYVHSSICKHEYDEFRMILDKQTVISDKAQKWHQSMAKYRILWNLLWMFDNFRNVNYEKNAIINVLLSDANTQDTLEKNVTFLCIILPVKNHFV